MITSERFWTRAYWLGRVDPRPLAVFRVGLGLTILHDLVDLTRDFRGFLTDEGMLPRGVDHAPWAWSVFDLAGSTAGVAAIFALGTLAVLAFTVGLFTRVATLLSWIFLVSIFNRNFYIKDGGDDLVHILLFWSMFADVGACWSVDASRRGRAFEPARAIGLRVLQLHIVLLYAVTGLLKLRGSWLGGTVIYQALQLDGFVRPLGALLRQSPALCAIANYSVLAMELAFPVLALSPFFVKQTRALAVACGLAVQLGILFTMRVGVFTETMLWAMVLFARPEWIDAVEGAVRRGLGRASASSRAMSGVEQPATPLAIAFTVAVALQFLVTAWSPFFNNRAPLPAWVKEECLALNLTQPMDLFGTIYAVPRWSAPGVLDDGSTVDVVAAVIPAAHDEPSLHFSRWTKFTFKHIERPVHYAELGAFLCRAYNERPGSRLRSFTLVNDARLPRVPGAPIAPDEHLVLHEQTCM